MNDQKTTSQKYVPLGDLTEIISGAPFKSELFNENGDGLPVIRVRDVNTGPAGIYYSGEFKPQYVIKNGDLLISMDGDFNCVSWKYGKALLNQRVCKIIPNVELLSPHYLRLFLPNALSEIHRDTTYTTVKHLSVKTIREIEIPLPPLEDQKRIAYLLSKVEGLIAQRKQHLQQLEDLLKSVFHDMFGPSSPKFSEWPMVPISELAASDRRSMRTGPFGSNLLHSEFNEDGDVAVLGIDNAVNNKFEWGQRRFITLEKYEQLKNYRIYPGDVIITIMGTIGRSAVIPEDIPLAINTKHLAAITVERQIANPTYLSYSIHSSPHIRKQLASKDRGAIMSGLNLTLIKETLIPRPPVDLQDEFARIHDRTQSLQSRIRVTIDGLQTLYGALANLAFKGELDLSRTTAIAESIEGEPENETDKPTTVEEPSFELPTPGNSLVDDSAQVNQEVLHTWLTAYCQHKGHQRISADEFLKLVDQKLMDISIERNAEWLPQSVDLSAYEQVRKWIFEELRAHRLNQSYDNKSNRVRVLAAKD